MADALQNLLGGGGGGGGEPGLYAGSSAAEAYRLRDGGTLAALANLSLGEVLTLELYQNARFAPFGRGAPPAAPCPL